MFCRENNICIINMNQMTQDVQFTYNSVYFTITLLHLLTLIKYYLIVKVFTNIPTEGRKNM